MQIRAGKIESHLPAAAHRHAPMSDLSLRLLQATSQLPISSYFDAALYEREQQKLFAKGPRYLGHELAVPNMGDFYALPHEGEGRA